MKGYNTIQEPLITLSIFDRISKPDAVSYLRAINACAQIAMSRRAHNLYQRIVQHLPAYQTDLRIMNALIDMFGKVNERRIEHSFISVLLVCGCHHR